MKKVFAILAIAALASCGGSTEAPAADTTVKDSAATTEMAPAADAKKEVK
jgi:predicted small lipoprotein YifL